MGSAALNTTHDSQLTHHVLCGLAFSSVRRKLLERFPQDPLAFGLVVNDDEEGICRGSHICYWNERMLDETVSAHYVLPANPADGSHTPRFTLTGLLTEWLVTVSARSTNRSL